LPDCAGQILQDWVNDMRFLITMNMPSAAGNTVHQVTVDHPANSLVSFCAALNSDVFVICRNFYRRTNNDGTMYWEDRGEIILNTTHIGKVQVFIEQDRTGYLEDTQAIVERRGPHFEIQRGPIRPRR
jgi:hypothetical protein